eukprot:gene14777-biopygen15696
MPPTACIRPGRQGGAPPTPPGSCGGPARVASPAGPVRGAHAACLVYWEPLRLVSFADCRASAAAKTGMQLRAVCGPQVRPANAMHLRPANGMHWRPINAMHLRPAKCHAFAVRKWHAFAARKYHALMRATAVSCVQMRAGWAG